MGLHFYKSTIFTYIWTDFKIVYKNNFLKKKLYVFKYLILLFKQNYYDLNHFKIIIFKIMINILYYLK